MNYKFKNLIFAAIIFLMIFGVAQFTFAAPSVSSVSGNITHGQNITINGSGFGIKNPAKPLVYADFESSINPDSNKGQRSSWDAVGCLSWITGSECPGNSGGCAKSTDGSQTCFEQRGVALGVNYNAWGNSGQQFYAYKKHRMNFLIVTNGNQNWKSWRIYPANLTGNVNCLVGTSQSTIICESYGGELWDLSRHNIGIEDGHDFTVKTTDWYIEEILFQASDIMTANGRIIFYYDGVLQFDKNWATRGTAANHNDDILALAFPVHDLAANIPTWTVPWSTENRSWFDDVYVDTTWARIMICAGSTWDNRGHCEIQIPSAWSDTSATVAVNAGTLTGNNYLYVVDSTNTANADGYPITIGTAPDTTPPASPTGLIVN